MSTEIPLHVAVEKAGELGVEEWLAEAAIDCGLSSVVEGPEVNSEGTRSVVVEGCKESSAGEGAPSACQEGLAVEAMQQSDPGPRRLQQGAFAGGGEKCAKHRVEGAPRSTPGHGVMRDLGLGGYQLLTNESGQLGGDSPTLEGLEQAHPGGGALRQLPLNMRKDALAGDRGPRLSVEPLCARVEEVAPHGGQRLGVGRDLGLLAGSLGGQGGLNLGIRRPFSRPGSSRTSGPSSLAPPTLGSPPHRLPHQISTLRGKSGPGIVKIRQSPDFQEGAVSIRRLDARSRISWRGYPNSTRNDFREYLMQNRRDTEFPSNL